MSEESPQSRIDIDAKLEAEIEEALGDMSWEDMLDIADRPPTQRGERERKIGEIVSVQGDDVFVEFGPKSQGVCPRDLFEDEPPIGEKMEFIIDRFDSNDGLLILSRKGKVAKADWEMLDVGQIVEARCTGTNKGGLEMEIAQHPAFMPAGQVDLRHIEDLDVFIGEKMPCEVIEIDRMRGRIILSRKSHLEAERRVIREKLLEELEVGKTFPAVISSIQPYGAFADLGGVDGLIHISDLSHHRIKNPEEVVQLGQQVEVQILKIDDAADPPKIGLGLKQTMDDPYEQSVGEFKEGGIITGKVTKLMAFGAFVELAPSVEGLIHISELSHDRVGKVSSVVKPDEIVTVKILSIDPGRRRIALSLKQAQSETDQTELTRKEDPHMRKLKAQLSEKFGELKGGIG